MNGLSPLPAAAADRGLQRKDDVDGLEVLGSNSESQLSPQATLLQALRMSHAFAKDALLSGLPMWLSPC